VLVAEITLAAREQAQGIEHVSIAIEQMNKVAQDAAESASQIAHAAEQTHDQAKRVEDLVEQGIEVVGFKVRRREASASVQTTVVLNRSQGMTRSLSQDGKPKLNGPTSQAERHFKDF
jgi:hypothetical protein